MTSRNRDHGVTGRQATGATGGSFHETPQASNGGITLTQSAPGYRDACEAADLFVMEGMLDIVADRENVDPAVLDSLTADDVEELYEAYVGPALDLVEDDLSSGRRGEQEAVDEEVSKHLDGICFDAGDPAMSGALLAIADRGNTERDRLLALTPDDVGDIYGLILAPWVDRLEDDLLSRRSSVQAFEDGAGGHVRSDGKQGFTCGSCGGGYASQAGLDAHPCEADEALESAKDAYLARLGVDYHLDVGGWDLLHEHAEADFEAGFRSTLDRDQAIREFNDSIEGEEVGFGLRQEDFTAGLDARP